MSIRKLGRVDPVYDALRVQTMMLPFAGGSGVPSAAIAFGKIIVIHHDGGGAEIFPVTAAGLTAALAAADAGDAVWLPPMAALIGNWTIPVGIGVQAYGKKANLQATLTGVVTLSASSFLNSVYVNPSISSGGAVAGVIGPAAGVAAPCASSVRTSGPYAASRPGYVAR